MVTERQSRQGRGTDAPSQASRRGRGDVLLIQAGLDHIDQGISIFDDERALVAWNRVFFQMLAFLEKLARRGKPFSAFTRHNAERGGDGPGAPMAPSSSCSTTRTTSPRWC